MRIDKRFKVRTVAKEHLLLMQGRDEKSMTRLMAFNESAYLMWTELCDRDFEVEDAQQVLLDNYEVEPEVALADASKWVETLKENGIIV